MRCQLVILVQLINWVNHLKYPKTSEKMGRLNNWIKAIVLNFNTIFSLVGLSIIGLAIFVLVNDWGSLDKKFFLGWGILSIFFGFFIYLASTVGYLGVRFQARRSGMWRGRRIIGLYQFILLACLIVELWWVIKLASAVKSMDVTQDSLRSGKVISYDALEVNMANRFNEFFFGAAGSCAGTVNSVLAK